MINTTHQISHTENNKEIFLSTRNLHWKTTMSAFCIQFWLVSGDLKHFKRLFLQKFGWLGNVQDEIQIFVLSSNIYYTFIYMSHHGRGQEREKW